MALIGISGKKQSGKDTVGKIIQYLTTDWENLISEYHINRVHDFNEYLDSIWNKEEISGWQIKKFADKLKDIVCLLIGCTREQLEYEKFKNTELGEEWWFYEYNLENGTIISVDKFKKKSEINKGITDSYYTLIKPTPRFLLQHIGTDLFRNKLNPNIWVNSLMHEYIITESYKGIIIDFKEDTIKETGWKGNNAPNWIITDLRFPNELKAVKNRGGISIRVNKQIIKHSENHSYVLNTLFDKDHHSETALDNAKFDYVIDNNGSIEELIEKVKVILIKEGIL